MTDASGSTSWTYDNRDRVLTKAAPAGTLTYTWDAHGNVASVLSSNTGGVSIGYAWDSLNRLQTVTDNRLSSVSSYTYDNVGNLATVTYPNGVIHSFTYDLRDQPTTLQLTKTAAVLASYSQVFGLSGQKTSVTESARSVAYSYDAVYKLLSETITGGSVSGAIGYTLDPVGNRLTRTSSVTGIPAQSFNYDAADRLTTDTYDNNGNTLSSGGNSYTYDFLDRLATGPGVTMVYDGDGNRVSRTVSGVTTTFVVDEFTPTGYAQVAEEVVSGAVVRRYTHGLQRISQTVSSVSSYYGYDGGMSVRQLFDGSGAVTDTFDYDAFGNLVASTGTTQNVYLYRGEQYDPALGFYYLRTRWMNAGTGRFMTVDKFDPPSCDTQDKLLHAYLYADADPVDRIDPDGYNAREVALTWQVTSALRPAVALGISAAAVCTLELSAWILGNVVVGIMDGFDFTLERQPWSCIFFAKRKGWTCRARCQWNNYSGGGGVTYGPWRTGTGSTESQACQQAKDNAQATSPRGSYTRHCKCDKCWQ